jgi:hypothetical protein
MARASFRDAEELACFIERETMFLLIGKALRTVPGDPHRNSVSHWRSPSMADQQNTLSLPLVSPTMFTCRPPR